MTQTSWHQQESSSGSSDKPSQSVPKRIDTIFFDRDGIINNVVMRGEVVGSPRNLTELHIRPDFLALYEQIKNSRLNLFVVSNQPDVARNIMPAADLEQISVTISEQAAFKEIVYCIHDNAHNCRCRKPKPGMILDLLDKYNLRSDTALIIGDSHKDILAGKAAGIATAYLLGSYNAAINCEPDVVVTSLSELTYNFQLRTEN